MGEVFTLDAHKGITHITPMKLADMHKGMIGESDYVFNEGNKFAIEIVSNNKVRIKDGVMIQCGIRSGILSGDALDVTITNGVQNKFRNTLVVNRWEYDPTTQVSKNTFVSIDGTAVSEKASATDPAINSTPIVLGSTIHETAMYRVELEGLNIVKITPLFSTVNTTKAIDTALSKAQADIIANANSFDYLNKLHSNGEVINDVLNIDTDNPLGKLNTKTWVVHSDSSGGSTIGMPKNCTLGFRTFEYLNNGWNIIKILELLPIQGRIWSRRYDAGQKIWFDWECNQVGKFIKVLDLPSVGGNMNYTCTDFSDSKELLIKANINGQFPTFLTLPIIVGEEGMSSFIETMTRFYHLGVCIVDNSKTITTTTYSRGSEWNSLNIGLTVYKKV